MKRQKRKAGGRQGQGARPAAAQRQPNGGGAAATSSRRGFLKRAVGGAAAVAAVGVGGWYLVAEVRAGLREEDLSQIGNGIPAVVQIHDPQCPQCRALQRETRDALAAFDGSELQYLIANIRSDEGRRFAATHGVGHVTLLLFDGDGEHRDTLVGRNTAEHLERAFRRHLHAPGS